MLVLLLFLTRATTSQPTPLNQKPPLTQEQETQRHEKTMVVCTDKKGEETYVFLNSKIIKVEESGILNYTQREMFTIQTPKGKVKVASTSCKEVNYQVTN